MPFSVKSCFFFFFFFDFQKIGRLRKNIFSIKNDIKLWDFSLLANVALLGTSQGHMLPDYTYLKKFFISSRQNLSNAFM